ncbi:CHASE2 domain-containing protein [Nitratidesulfovibrio sp. HK-II]|uniref:CHASE2 domain-containing protein n=1 Tax=Nitratidesulfovibrio sp. HK-II TaxID=2009266 RepID=UPI000E2EC925|nr:CHASE2 domain-containing protein [Nitratidesulfovibrio sp. HK-II]GBO94979.1 HD-GYP domain [Nitratidesulfovibrio sp. HK-II]
MPSPAPAPPRPATIPRARLVAAVTIAGLVLSALFCLVEPGLVQLADNRILDGLARHRVRQSTHAQPGLADPSGRPDQVVIVDIDEESLAAAGQWPWPRYLTGGIVRRIAEALPAAVGVDILFSEPDRTSIATIRKAFQRDFGLDITIAGVPRGMEDNDAYFGSVLAKAEAVGAVMHLFDLITPDPENLPRPVRVTGETTAINPAEATGILCNAGPIQAGLAGSGFINVEKDEDGSIRRVPLLHRFQGQYYPSLALALFLHARSLRELRVETDALGPVLVAGATRIPVDGEARMRLRFDGGARAHRFVPAADLLRDAQAPALFAGRIVILGSSAARLNDLHHTPVSANYPGTEVHAVALDNLLDGNHHRDPAHPAAYRFIPAALVTMLAGLLFLRAGPLRAGGATLLAALAFPAVGSALYLWRGIALPMSAPVLAALAQGALLSLALYARERRMAFVRLRQLNHARQMTLESMTAVAESRDEISGAHIKRTQHYVRALAEALRDIGRGGGKETYPQLTEDYIDLLFHSAPLHDVGKVAVPDSVLFKPGKLTDEEYAVIRQHVRHGRNIIANAAQGMEDDAFLHLAAEIAWSHHEKWDGTGYMEGLAGEAIPLSGRLMAVADVYDALICARQYKPAFPHAKVREIILQGRGSHFDPAVVDAFLLAEEEFKRIATAYRDPEPGHEPDPDPPGGEVQAGDPRQ